jgi:acyl-CoA synthetase (AMP-forming)/AMP-acid ligase II
MMSPGRPTTIPEALAAAASAEAGEHMFHLDDGVVALSSAELAERAERAARRLVALGVAPGDSVGVLGPNRPEWIVWAYATWLAGAVLVPVQIPLRVRDPAAFREQLRRLVAAAGCRRVLADPRLAGLLPAEVGVAWDANGPESSEEPQAPAPDAAAVIQFTSGSTAHPKGAILTHAAVMAQIDLLRHGYRYEDGTPRAVLGWTPFFHDLGLFANLTQPSVTGSTTHHLPTERFARDPATWLRLVEETRAAATVAPSAAFGSALRTVIRRGESLDLSSLDTAYFAAEGIDPEVAQRMIDTARRFGFRPEALGGTYGLAEAVMAVSYSLPGTGLHIDRISLPELVESSVAVPAGNAPERLVVSSGPPHAEVRVVGPEGIVAERQVGEIQVRGPSLMSGYTGSAAPSPIVDGWLHTGDLGYLTEGELYVTGRIKDVMIAAGHNHYPEDFEWAAARVDGVKPGRCVAFSAPQGEGIVVLVEAGGTEVAEGLEREVMRTVANAIGIAPAQVVVLPAGTVQKTTSGKLRRAAMRDAFSSGIVAPS